MFKSPVRPKVKESNGYDLDAALKESLGQSNGNGTTTQQPEEKNKNGYDLDAALKQSLTVKKKDGGNESATISEVPTSTSETQLPSQENNGEGVSVFDNSTLNPSLQKTSSITTPDGAELKITKVTPLNTEGLQAIQERVSTKTATPEDIQTLANATGKSVKATQTYLQQGQQQGALVENNDNVQKNQQKLIGYINDFNKNYGTNYAPNEVLSSSQKTLDFLNTVKARTLENAKNQDITKPLDKAALNKLSFDFQGNDLSTDMINEVVNKTVDENKNAGVSKDATIATIAKIINPKEYNKTVNAQTPTTSNILAPNPIAALGDLVRDDKGEDELLNYQKGIAEIKYNQALKQNGLNKMSVGYINGNPDLIKQGQQELTQVDDNVIDKYPALQKQEIVQRVNDTIAKESGVVEGSDTESGHRLERAFGADVSDRIRVMKDLGYLDNPKTKDAAMSLIANPQLFADNSILGSVASSFAEPFKNLGMSIGDITGFRSNKDLLADNLKDELFPKDFSGNNPDDPNVLHLKNDVRISRNIANTTANLAGMLAIATATEGIATEAGLSINVGQKLGAYTSFGLPAFDASLKDSKNFIDSEPTQYIYAAINSIANAEGGRLLDLGKITRIPGVSDEFAKIAKGLSDKSITEKATKELLNGAQDKFVDFAVKYGKNVTKGAATMAYFSIANNVLKMGFGDPNTTTESTITQAGHAFLDGVLGMSIIGGFGAAADMRAEKNTTYKGTIYNMAVNHDSAKDILDLGLKNGEYTKPEYDEKVQILNTAVAAKNALDATEQETGTDLTQDQKAVYVANKTAQAIFKNKSEQEGITDQQKNSYIAQSKKLAEQSTQTLDGLKFTSTLEPLYDLYNAEKEYNLAKENFNPADKKSDDALLAAKDNYDKLYSNYLKDIPDNIQSQSKTNQNEENNGEKSSQSSSQENNAESSQKNGTEGIRENVNNQGVDKTAPSIESLRKVRFENVDQKIKEVEIDDPVFGGKRKPMSAQKVKIEYEKRYDILQKFVNCLT